MPVATDELDFEKPLTTNVAVQVIAGIDTAVRSMRVGGIRRVVIPPDQGYQNKEQGPVPPDVSLTLFRAAALLDGLRSSTCWPIAD